MSSMYMDWCSSSSNDYVELNQTYCNVNIRKGEVHVHLFQGYTTWWLGLSQAILSRPLYKLEWGYQSQYNWLNINWIFASGTCYIGDLMYCLLLTELLFSSTIFACKCVISLHKWRHQACWWSEQPWRSCGDLWQCCLGHCVWLLLGSSWCKCGMWTTWI